MTWQVHSIPYSIPDGIELLIIRKHHGTLLMDEEVGLNPEISGCRHRSGAFGLSRLGLVWSRAHGESPQY
jgi:hypothetical protein